MSQERFPTLAKASRAAKLMIVPAVDVFAPFSECSLCSWVGDARHRAMRLKYLSASCHVHADVPRISA